MALHSRLRPASPGFCSPGSCMCVFSVVLQFEASARLLLARVVSVCFCCCPSIRGSAHRARLLLAGVVVPTCCLVVPFLFCSVPDRSFSWGCWGRLCFSQWSPRLVRAHRFLAASLGPGEQWRGPHVAPVASVHAAMRVGLGICGDWGAVVDILVCCPCGFVGGACLK